MAWLLIPAVFAARYLRASSRAVEDTRQYATDLLTSKGQSWVIPSPLNQRLQDPHQPMLNDQVGYPQQLAPKTYRGKVEPPKPYRLDGHRANFERTLVNMDHVPRSNQLNRIMYMQQAFKLSTKGMCLPWDPPRPDLRAITNRVWYIKRNLREHSGGGSKISGDRGRPVVRVPLGTGLGRNGIRAIRGRVL